ncbi:NifU-like protein involved in Fe-S cluster formation [Bartonella sp. CDC_skunk]|uniref:iron-sulfur cluster assembly scaffold protein n=1 Tax=unclassified Bartonella TaxID=2645622 RepID=UPI00099996B2|nr:MULTISPECIES: iron-sulfur cluster assembly scaffold protein [unclassified Bartonella]AQX21295.1 NifU-like protein involved in Fe-S cluster formation [Bartonella sp. CDC_skunk]AQX26553.1 NifU-like protein involved in Fe-S cluster formation [Bartonella sp. Raccoon60]
MIDNIYSNKILEHAAHISRIGRLNNPDATSKKYARFCGSTVTVDLKVENSTIIDFSHEICACVLGQASSSILANHIIGQKTQDLKILYEIIQHMLIKDGSPPSPPFEEFACLKPIKNYQTRHASVMLTFDAVIDCIKQIEEKMNG